MGNIFELGHTVSDSTSLIHINDRKPNGLYTTKRWYLGKKILTYNPRYVLCVGGGHSSGSESRLQYDSAYGNDLVYTFGALNAEGRNTYLRNCMKFVPWNPISGEDYGTYRGSYGSIVRNITSDVWDTRPPLSAYTDSYISLDVDILNPLEYTRTFSLAMYLNYYKRSYDKILGSATTVSLTSSVPVQSLSLTTPNLTSYFSTYTDATTPAISIAMETGAWNNGYSAKIRLKSMKLISTINGEVKHIFPTNSSHFMSGTDNTSYEITGGNPDDGQYINFRLYTLPKTIPIFMV